MAHSVSFENNYLVQFNGTIGNLLGGTNFDAIRSGSSFTVDEEIFNLFADPGISYTYLGTSPTGDGVFYQENFGVGNIFFATNSDISFGTGTTIVEIKYDLVRDPHIPTSDDDLIIGSSGNDVFDGLGGNDTIFGHGGNDRLFGSNGNDTLHGNQGKDQLNGGRGNDDLFGGTGKDTVRGGDGKDDVLGGAGDDNLFGGKGKDTLSGGDGDYILAGNQGDDTLFGEDGKDLMLGGSGDDRLVGGKGNDALFGGTGDDILVGNRGRDLLSGDAGNDKLTGGGGSDRFIFDDDWGKDKITDFNVDQDKLNFKAVQGVSKVADLTINANAQGLRISDGSDVIILQGLGASDINDLDFIF